MQSHRCSSHSTSGFSGRHHTESMQCQQSLHLRKSCVSHRQLRFVCFASDTNSGGFGGAVKNFARRIQSRLPIVGLLSRLTTDTGGIGSDEMAYPEFARKLLNVSDASFNEAVNQWAEKYGQVGQRKYVLLFMWMAKTGLGYVPSKKIALAASRLRVTQDIEIEVERFEMARKDALEMYAFNDRPKGRTKEQVDIAVDSLARLSLGLKDGDPIPEEAKPLLTTILTSTFEEDTDQIQEIVATTLTDGSRNSRKSVNQ